MVNDQIKQENNRRKFELDNANLLAPRINVYNTTENIIQNTIQNRNTNGFFIFP